MKTLIKAAIAIAVLGLVKGSDSNAASCQANKSPSNSNSCNPGTASSALYNFQDQGEQQAANTYCMACACYDFTHCQAGTPDITTGCDPQGTYNPVWQETYTGTADLTCTSVYNYKAPATLNPVNKGEWDKYVVDGANCGGS